MANADSMKTGGSTGAVGPSLMKKIVPPRVELRDMVAEDRKRFKKIHFAGFDNKLLKLCFNQSCNKAIKFHQVNNETILNTTSVNSTRATLHSEIATVHR